jgi:hypothetical protein
MTLGELRDFLKSNPPDADWADELEDLRRFVSFDVARHHSVLLAHVRRGGTLRGP